jgi:hypothetical protein
MRWLRLGDGAFPRSFTQSLQSGSKIGVENHSRRRRGCCELDPVPSARWRLDQALKQMVASLASSEPRQFHIGMVG